MFKYLWIIISRHITALNINNKAQKKRNKNSLQVEHIYAGFQTIYSAYNKSGSVILICNNKGLQ